MKPPRLNSAADALAYLGSLGAPPRLVAHGRVVAETAAKLGTFLRHEFSLDLDSSQIETAAALHDCGKVEHPEELTGSGRLHESVGEAMLLRAGVDPDLARFCRTHANWNAPDARIEDLVVALADHLWKGVRNEALELALVKFIASGRQPDWKVYSLLDSAFASLAAGAEERLAFQLGEPV